MREEPERTVYVSQISKHYSKPGVTPVEVLPVFPDFKVGTAPCRFIFSSAFSRPHLVFIWLCVRFDLCGTNQTLAGNDEGGGWVLLFLHG